MQQQRSANCIRTHRAFVTNACSLGMLLTECAQRHQEDRSRNWQLYCYRGCSPCGMLLGPWVFQEHRGVLLSDIPGLLLGGRHWAQVGKAEDAPAQAPLQSPKAS